MGTFKMCMCFPRKFKINEFQIPFDIREAFSRFTDGGTLMSSEQLLRFLVEYQGEITATESDAEQIIHQVMHRRHRIVSFTKHALTTEDFLHYLLAEDLNPPIGKQVHHDMTSPLSHYFIYTGHNSYLTGNQLSSECSDAPIIKALMRGVRVIELDLWPNPTKDNVHVVHGRTLTSPVSLLKCLKSIKEYAFSASPYPVIITLEDHLTPDLQAKVAEMVTQTFGDMLYCPETDYMKEFPSPEGLKYRIVLSTKPPKEYLEDKNLKEKDSSEEDTWDSEFSEAREEFLSDGELSDEEEVTETCRKSEVTETCRKSCQLGAPEYKKLIAIPAKKKKGGLKASLTVDPLCVRRLSLSEQKLIKAKSRHGADVIRFTQRNLLRVYPKGTRFNSSNYNPLVSWKHGAQMVAFNMQGYGRSLWLMHGMFRANGGCGYVKKPDILLDSDQIFDPKAVIPVKKTLKVVVYMGDGWRLDFDETHFDTYSPPDFYVKVAIAGVPGDTAKQKTKVIEDEWTPVWDKEFWFPLTVPELALLRIEVHEHDRNEKDDFGGQTVLPVWELRRGIRAVPLFTRKGDKFRSVKLLMQFQFV